MLSTVQHIYSVKVLDCFRLVWFPFPVCHNRSQLLQIFHIGISTIFNPIHITEAAENAGISPYEEKKSFKKLNGNLICKRKHLFAKSSTSSLSLLHAPPPPDKQRAAPHLAWELQGAPARYQALCRARMQKKNSSTPEFEITSVVMKPRYTWEAEAGELLRGREQESDTTPPWATESEKKKTTTTTKKDGRPHLQRCKASNKKKLRQEDHEVRSLRACMVSERDPVSKKKKNTKHTTVRGLLRVCPRVSPSAPEAAERSPRPLRCLPSSFLPFLLVGM